MSNGPGRERRDIFERTISLYSVEDCGGRRLFQGKVNGALKLFERLNHHPSVFAILFHCIHQCEVAGLPVVL